MGRGQRLLKNRYLFGEIGENPMRDDVPYPMIYDGGGGTSKIFFEITSAEVAGTSSPYNGKMILTVNVIVEPCDEDIDTTEVVDWSDCLANAETTGALVGRQGWAVRGRGRQSLASDAEVGEKTPCHWMLDGLCCPE